MRGRAGNVAQPAHATVEERHRVALRLHQVATPAPAGNGLLREAELLLAGLGDHVAGELPERLTGVAIACEDARDPRVGIQDAVIAHAQDAVAGAAVEAVAAGGEVGQTAPATISWPDGIAGARAAVATPRATQVVDRLADNGTGASGAYTGDLRLWAAGPLSVPGARARRGTARRRRLAEAVESTSARSTIVAGAKIVGQAVRAVVSTGFVRDTPARIGALGVFEDAAVQRLNAVGAARLTSAVEAFAAAARSVAAVGVLVAVVPGRQTAVGPELTVVEWAAPQREAGISNARARVASSVWRREGVAAFPGGRAPGTPVVTDEGPRVGRSRVRRARPAIAGSPSIAAGPGVRTRSATVRTASVLRAEVVVRPAEVVTAGRSGDAYEREGGGGRPHQRTTFVQQVRLGCAEQGMHWPVQQSLPRLQ
jgi:hypothetical protein